MDAKGGSRTPERTVTFKVYDGPTFSKPVKRSIPSIE
jgi:hypothetical protein